MTGRDGRQPRGGDDLPTDWDAAYTDVPPWDIGRPQQPSSISPNGARSQARSSTSGAGAGSTPCWPLPTGAMRSAWTWHLHGPGSSSMTRSTSRRST